MAENKVVIGQNPEKPIEKIVLAKAIVDISRAVSNLSKGGLNRKAIAVLVSHKSGKGRSTVEAVLNALERLQEEYCA